MAELERTRLCAKDIKPAKARLVSVEPVYLLLMVTTGAITTTRVQYVQHRLTEDYNYTLSKSPLGACSSANESDDVIGKRIQSETAVWAMLMSSLTTFLPLLTGAFLVASSDVVGRKPLLILSAVVHVVSAGILMVVTALKLPLAVILVAKSILGIFGDMAVPLSVCLAYVGDSTTLETRVVKMTTLELGANFGWGMGKLLTNVILQKTSSFTLAFGFSMVSSFMCLLYTTCPGVLLETIQSNHSKGTVVDMMTLAIARLRSACYPKWIGLRWRIGTLYLVKMLVYIVKESIYTIVVIIGLGKPFCWQPLTVGIYEAVVSLFPAIVSMLLAKPCLCLVNEYWLIHFGVLTFIGQLLFYTFATTTMELMIYAQLVGFFRTLPSVMVKVLLSSLVSPDEQGAVFAGFSLVVSFSTAISPLIMNGIYSATVLVGKPQVVFFVGIALLACANVLTGMLQIHQPKEEKEKSDIELQSLKPDNNATNSK